MALDPRISALMWLAARTGRAFRPDVRVEEMRAAYARMNGQFGLRSSAAVAATDLAIPRPDGSSIGARLYVPRRSGDAALPVLLYFHGGGYVIGDVAGYDGLTRCFAGEGRIAVLSVEYRLGPEDPFPSAHEDAFVALSWLQREAADRGLDAGRIAVGGDSAGGGLAAALASYAESRGIARPAFAFLIYPAVDGTGRFPSRRQFAGSYPLTPEAIAWFVRYSLRSADDASSPLLVPLDAPHPERHPPAYVLAAAYDPLVDEGRAYAERLRAAGVAVTYDLRPTLPHAFVNLGAIVPEARRAVLAGIRATAAALGVRRVAAITGAGSGIGRALALELAARGYALALADVDVAGLGATAALLAERTKVTTYAVDVSNRDAVERFAADVLRDHGCVDVLVNNAGVTIAGDVAQLSVDEMAWVVDVNFWGTVYGVKAFLPAMQRAGEGTIVNISSVFGLLGPPGQSVYAASKFAVRGFSESLREELRESGVHVVTVHPGGVRTNIARRARIAAAADQERERRRALRMESHLTLAPEKAAAAIVRGIEARSDRVLVGADAYRIDALSRALGPLGTRIFASYARKRPARAAAPRRGDEPLS